MTQIPVSDLPQELMFHKEWRRICFMPNGERDETFNSRWYDNEQIARSLLNAEYPEPTTMGYRFRLQERWISEFRAVDP